MIKLLLLSAVVGVTLGVSEYNVATVEPVEISYGAHDLQKLDFYRSPNSDKKIHDVVVNIHGGGWVIGDKRQFTAPMARIRDLALEQGYDVIVPNYRLAPDNQFPAAINDLHAVEQWIEANKNEYKLSGNYIVSGESGGANLGGYISVDGNGTPGNKGYIGFAGYYKLDIEADDSPVAGRMQLYLGCLPSQCPALARQASPYWNMVLTPPMLLVHGDGDDFVGSYQSYAMASINSNATVMLIEGGLHTGPTMVRKDIDTNVKAFLQEHLPQ